MGRAGKQKGVRLQVVISAAIVISMMVLAISLTFQSYITSRSGLISQLEINTKQLAKSVDFKIEYVTQSVIGAVRLLQMDPANYAPNLRSQLVRLPELAKTLYSNPVLSAIYIGYQNGDFLLLRTLRSEKEKERIKVPQNTQYVLQSIQHLPTGQPVTRWLFYSKQLQYLGQRFISNDVFDPRTRPWYIKAQTVQGMIQTKPYIFYTTKEVGITVAVRNPHANTVVGVDASIEDLSDAIRALQPNSQYLLALLDSEQNVVGYPDSNKVVIKGEGDKLRLAKVDELGSSILSYLAQQNIAKNVLSPVSLGSQKWYGEKVVIGNNQGMLLTLLFATPEKVLLASANKHLISQLYWSFAIMVVLVIFGWLLGRAIARPLLTLSKGVGALSHFDFSRQNLIRSPIREVNQLSELTSQMANTIQHFQLIAKELSRDKDLENMLDQVSRHLVTITSSQAGAVYLCDENENELTLATSCTLELPSKVQFDGRSQDQLVEGIQRSNKVNNAHLSITPLLDRHDKILGALVLIIPHQADHGKTFARFIDEVSGLASTAIETRRQVESQRALLDSMIVLLADAIDEKSPYTAGHCERVPMLAEMVIDAAESAQQGVFANFSMTKTERREFRIAAWLHDCGKITSPEYVVDKATKLETIYNRIHEIRTRFEVLWRDAQISYLEGNLRGEDSVNLKRQLSERQEQLRADFAFVANANIGSECISEENKARLADIGKQTWLRYFDNGLGLASEEESRLFSKVETLPVKEMLLRDAPEHLIPWGDRRPAVEKSNPENIWGFDMALPEYKFNLGERYNLLISKGTLTDEERFVINDHIVQTIKMLSALLLPDDLKRVPDIAGNHHERVDGKGYPRGLVASELSVAERVMALADVFEALTAADRPYKKAKPLSESLTILAHMVKDRHLDGQVFRLFIESSVYVDYAKKYLHTDQIDDVDHLALFDIAGLSS